MIRRGREIHRASGAQVRTTTGYLFRVQDGQIASVELSRAGLQRSKRYAGRRRAGRGDNAPVAYDEALATRIRELVKTERGLTEKRMFGGLAFLVDGNMAVSASGQGGLLLRVDPDETADLVKRPHAQPFEMRGRPMQGWLRVGPEGVRTKRQLEPWVRRGVAYARSLPGK